MYEQKQNYKKTKRKKKQLCQFSCHSIPAVWTTENDPLRSRGSLITKWRRLGKEVKQEKGKLSLFFSISYGRLYSEAGLYKEVPHPRFVK